MNSASITRNILILFCFVIFGDADNAFSQDFLKHRDSFNIINWKFYKGDILSAESGDKISEQGWENVTIPHTWNAKDVLTEGDHCYQGVAWYRSSFDLSQEQKSRPFDSAQGRQYWPFDMLRAGKITAGGYNGVFLSGFDRLTKVRHFCIEM